MDLLKIHPDFQWNGKSVANFTQLIDRLDNSSNIHRNFLQAWSNDTSYIIAHTSGSTGKPKSIKIPKQNLLHSARKTIDFFDLRPGTTALLNLSPDFIAGKLMWIRALTGGWHLDVIASDNKSIERQLSAKTYDFSAMVPLQVYYNLSNIHRIKQLIIGGGVVSEELQKKLYHLPNRIYATYGMTETLTHIAVKPLNKVAENQFYTDKIFSGAYHLLDGIGIELDSRGCLVIHAPEITAEPVVTNDLVKILDDKHFIWLGRIDNIINSGALKFIPEQIEEKLSAYIDVPFFIAGQPDEQLGEKLVLIVESKPFELPDFSKLLDRYEIPKQVFFIDRFVRTDSGKIKRAETLRKL